MKTVLPARGKIRNSAVSEQGMIAAPAKKSQALIRHGTSAGSPGKAVSYANRWRENYNPLRNLTIRRAVELLEMAQRGDTALLQWTFRFIERRHPTLSALISRCEAPLMTFDWEIKVKEQLPAIPGKSDEQVQQMAKAQQATLREAYDLVDNLQEAVKHLHLAQFRGYSHIQKHRTGDGEVSHLETLDQWCVCRDGLYGDWFWNPDSRFMTHPEQVLGEANRIGGEQLPLEDFIITSIARPIDEIGLINFVRQNLCEKDWDGFIEIYGIPGGVVVMPPNVPQGKESEYETAAKEVAQGGSGAVPNGADYKPNDGPRGVDPFTPRLKHLDEQLVMAGTGGKLTMLAESGAGTLAGSAHSDSFDEIADSRAEVISEIFQKQFDSEVLQREHEGEPCLVYFKLVAIDRSSEQSLGFKQELLKNLSSHEAISRVIANQTDLKETVRDTGLAVNEDYVDPYLSVQNTDGSIETGEVVKDSEGNVVGGKVEKTEDPRAKDAKDAKDQNDLTGKGNGDSKSEISNLKNREGKPELPTLEENGVEAYAVALAHDMQSVREEVEAISEIRNDEIFTNRAIGLARRIEKLKTDLVQLPGAARALAEVQVAALFTGLTEKRPAKNRGRKILNGDVPGHEFHGNQWTAGTAGMNEEEKQNYLEHGRRYDAKVAELKSEKNKYNPAPKPIEPGTHMRLADSAIDRAKQRLSEGIRPIDMGDAVHQEDITGYLARQAHDYPVSAKVAAQTDLAEAKKHIQYLGMAGGKKGGVFHPDAPRGVKRIMDFEEGAGL